MLYDFLVHFTVSGPNASCNIFFTCYFGFLCTGTTNPGVTRKLNNALKYLVSNGNHIHQPIGLTVPT